jgi:hypothetical protein
VAGEAVRGSTFTLYREDATLLIEALTLAARTQQQQVRDDAI